MFRPFTFNVTVNMFGNRSIILLFVFCLSLVCVCMLFEIQLTYNCPLYIYIFFLKQDLFFFKLFIYGCVGSSFLCEGFLQLRQVGATLHCGVRASHYRGLSCCGAQAPDAQAQ